MGTRADFYVGRGEHAEWIGSIAWDGYPEGIDAAVFKAKTEATYRKRVAGFFEGREDATLPQRGWPWPWETSHTTDYAYAFDEKSVYASCFGHKWFDPLESEPDDDDGGKVAEFPNMKERQNTRWDKGSGLIIIGGGL